MGPRGDCLSVRPPHVSQGQLVPFHCLLLSLPCQWASESSWGHSLGPSLRGASALRVTRPKSAGQLRGIQVGSAASPGFEPGATRFSTHVRTWHLPGLRPMCSLWSMAQVLRCRHGEPLVATCREVIPGALCTERSIAASGSNQYAIYLRKGS